MATLFTMPYAAVGNGISPSDGAKLYFYAVGTTTPQNTYTTSALSVANANPVVADADGLFPAIWLSGAYSVTLKNKNGVQIWYAPEVLEDTAYSIEYVPTQIDGIARTVNSKLSDFVSVKDFGAVGDGNANDTAAFSLAIAASDCVYVPEGTYLVTAISIPANTVIATAGYGTTIKRSVSATVGVSTITVTGSNVEIGSMKMIGDISTSTGEQNHGIKIQSTASTGSINNVTIGDIISTDMRGDSVYVGALSGYLTSNIKLGNVYGSNILRNVVTVAGVTGFTAGIITGQNVGLVVMDVEPEPTYTKAVDINVAAVIGKALNLASSSAANYIDAAVFGSVNLDATAYGTNSTPAYASGGVAASGLTLRNIKSIKFNALKIVGYNSFGIEVVYNGGELGCTDFVVDNLEMSNCSITDVTYNAYIRSQVITRFVCNNLNVDSSAVAGKTIFLYGPNVVVNNAQCVLGASGFMIRLATNFVLNNLTITGTGTLIASCTKGIVNNCVFTGAYLATFSSNLIFNNVTAAASTLVFNASYERHFITNSTLNTVAYGVNYDYDTFTVDSTNHRVGVLTASPAVPLDINGNSIRVRTAKTPSSAADTGSAGTICWDTSYVYVCTAANTWKRVAISTW